MRYINDGSPHRGENSVVDDAGGRQLDFKELKFTVYRKEINNQKTTCCWMSTNQGKRILCVWCSTIGSLFGVTDFLPPPCLLVLRCFPGVEPCLPLSPGKPNVHDKHHWTASALLLCLHLGQFLVFPVSLHVQVKSSKLKVVWYNQPHHRNYNLCTALNDLMIHDTYGRFTFGLISKKDGGIICCWKCVANVHGDGLWSS